MFNEVWKIQGNPGYLLRQDSGVFLLSVKKLDGVWNVDTTFRQPWKVHELISKFSSPELYPSVRRYMEDPFQWILLA